MFKTGIKVLKQLDTDVLQNGFSLVTPPSGGAQGCDMFASYIGECLVCLHILERWTLVQEGLFIERCLKSVQYTITAGWKITQQSFSSRKSPLSGMTRPKVCTRAFTHVTVLRFELCSWFNDLYVDGGRLWFIYSLDFSYQGINAQRGWEQKPLEKFQVVGTKCPVRKTHTLEGKNTFLK